MQLQGGQTPCIGLGAGTFACCLPVDKMPNRKKTSVQVTTIEMTIRIMMIHVMPSDVFSFDIQRQDFVWCTYASFSYQQ
jgi:hypothetical protein